MTDRKRKKISRQRGSRRHGGGSKKKRRGGGSQGGRGFSGMHKHKMSMMTTKYPDMFGKRGFASLRRKGKSINIKELEKIGNNEINLTEMGYGKLLGSGEIKRPVAVVVKKASAPAREKVEKAGGSVQEK